MLCHYYKKFYINTQIKQILKYNNFMKVIKKIVFFFNIPLCKKIYLNIFLFYYNYLYKIIFNEKGN